MGSEGGRAPLARGRERHRPGPAPAGRRGEGRAHRGEGRVAVRVVGERAEGRLGLGRVGPVDRLAALVDDLPLGEGPRLVQAHDVDAGQDLDRGQLLDQHLAAGQGDRRDGERQAGEQDEALGHHPDHPGDGAGERGRHRAGLELAPQQEPGDGDQRVLDDPQEQVDAVHELRAHQLEVAGLAGQPPGVGVGSDRGGLEAAGAGHDDAARLHRRVDNLVDGIRFAGQQRLVDLESFGPADDPVGGDLVAGSEGAEIVEHQVLDRHVDLGGVAHDPGPRCAQDGEAVELSFGQDLLDDADQRVRDEDEPEQPVLGLTHDEDDDEHRAEDRVEPGEHVGAHDLAVRPARSFGAAVGEALRHSVGDLGRGQPARGGLERGRRRRRRARFGGRRRGHRR